jgi:tRNA nucleotidyltransferase/poly(A) polymerase
VTPKDVDLHTDATPDECIKIYDAAGFRWEPTGMSHGTISVILDHVAFEITSLRQDVDTDGRHATVAYTRDWVTDCLRRDFTINSMSMSFEGELLDPFGGAADLEAGVVKFVGNAHDRIREDYLRILRWFRFRGRFEKNANVDTDARDAVIDLAAGLRQISRERIWSEISKTINGNNGPALLRSMHEMGVASHAGLSNATDLHVVPMQEVHKITRNPVTLLVSAYHHLAHIILEEFKASNQEQDLAKWLVHERFLTSKSPFFCMAVDNVSRSWAQELAALRLWDAFDRAVLDTWEPPVFPVTGHDLIKLGIKPGPDYTVILNKLRWLWADSGYTLTREQLITMV